jgi:hypothetical protein
MLTEIAMVLGMEAVVVETAWAAYCAWTDDTNTNTERRKTENHIFFFRFFFFLTKLLV